MISPATTVAAATVARRFTSTPMISCLLVNSTSGIRANGIPNDSTTWLITSVRDGSTPIAITTNAGIIVTARRTNRGIRRLTNPCITT